MKILQFITELTPAGAERVVCELAKNLKVKGHDVFVLSLMPLPENESILDELRSSQVEVQSLNVTKTTPWRIFGIRKVIKNYKPDIVHAHLIHPNIISRVAKIANPLKFRLINTVHIAERRPSKWWHFFLDRITFSLCDVETCVSKAVRDFHSTKIAKSPDFLPVIYNGLPIILPINEERILKLRKEWDLHHCSKVIGSVGRLDWQKGYDIFLEHLPKISEIIPEGEKWGIVILGEGKYRNELEKIINDRKFENITVKLPGFRKDAAQCIGAFDLFVMPSRYEGFGLTLIEAMMQGVPILASDADSLPELMEFYDNGECIDFLDNNIYSEKIEIFLKNNKAASSCRFNLENMVNEYLEIYYV
jgi:glycosyltransferase involved in cell wall biosynthesis